jgi:hypothetical protein
MTAISEPLGFVLARFVAGALGRLHLNMKWAECQSPSKHVYWALSTSSPTFCASNKFPLIFSPSETSDKASSAKAPTPFSTISEAVADCNVEHGCVQSVGFVFWFLESHQHPPSVLGT